MTAERTYDRFGTCDGCSQSVAIRLSSPDDGNSPYVCAACDEQFDNAVDVAAVTLAIELGHTMRSLSPPIAGPNTRRIAEKVVRAFIDADWDESQRRGESEGLATRSTTNLRDSA